MTPEEKIRRQEKANIDYMMRIHRRIDEIVEDQATADALKPWYMFMCKRPCFHNEYLPDVQPARTCTWSTRTARASPRSAPKGPVFDGSEYALDLLIYATGFEVQKTGTYNRIVGEDGRRPAGQVRATASARCSASTRTASRTCSSWAATRRRSTST